ncbi:MAG: DUF3306 domain-containing protein [Xanthobacteraceae bacterium]|jgi:hypothetical protein
MSDPKDFLTRWSRRKQAAATEQAQTTSSDPSSPAAPEGVAGHEHLAGAEPPGSDGRMLPSMVSAAARSVLESLPPIEAIAADTDIRGFLANGVPPELARAALRRAWAADPRIRDFVGLADYDWDFNTPGAMAGFGSLDMTEELCRLAARMVGPCPDQPTPDPAPVDAASGQGAFGPGHMGRAPPAGDQEDRESLVRPAAAEELEPFRHDRLTHAGRETGSAQSRPGKPVTSQTVDRRRHGGALPR